eukprot:14564378-Alexandrium_andersonii.AAC.1
MDVCRVLCHGFRCMHYNSCLFVNEIALAVAVCHRMHDMPANVPCYVRSALPVYTVPHSMP